MSDDITQDPNMDQKTQDVPADSGASQGGTGTDKYGRTLFKATCAGCGGEAMVPFQPTSGRPVYCQNCYKPRPRNNFGGGAGGASNGGSRGGNRPFRGRDH